MAETRANGIYGIKKRYVDLNLSSNVVDLVINSWAKGTDEQYSLHINRWFDYCTRHNIDSFDSSVNQGVEFLAEYFHEGVSYSMVNTARSALSSVFPEKGGTPFVKHPLIVRLLRGMYKQSPSLPRYTVTYDLAKVLQFISNSYSETSLEFLTKKLATLMCILSGQRSQTMSLLNINYMHLDESHCIFYIASLLKTTRPGFHQHPLEFMRYTDQSLCVIIYIKRYLLETKELRHSDGGFFISFKPPQKAVTSTTIAIWVVNVLKEAGVNVSVFSAHSTRSTASSKASDKGLNLAEISKAAGLSNAKTFAMFYKKTISEKIGQAILRA